MTSLDFSKNLLLAILFLCLILIQISAVAEYRAFELEIQNKETGQSRLVVSNFDQNQYAQLYPLNPNELIIYKTSWMCWENTSLRKVCAKPQTNE